LAGVLHPARKGVGVIWILHALLCAFFLALCDLCTKKFCADHSVEITA